MRPGLQANLFAVEDNAAPLQLLNQLLHEYPLSGHMLVLALAHPPAFIAAARSGNASARAADNIHIAHPRSLFCEHLQEVGILNNK